MEDFIDNRTEDPDFEPQRKKHKKNTDIISNDLMLYVITKFGKQFFTETDKVERKQICKMIAEDLIAEKSVVIEHELIYENLMTQKKTFLREKKKIGKTQNAKWPFFEAFLSLGSCIRSESSSTSDKKHSKDSKDSKRKSSRKSSSHKDSKKRSKDDSVNDSQTGVGLKDLFGGSFSETPPESDAQSESDVKIVLSTSNDGPSTSNSFNASQSTPKSENDKAATRSKGFLFDKSIGVQDKLGYFFGKYENDVDNNNVAGQVPVSNSKQPPAEFHSEAEMLAYLDTLIEKSPKKDVATSDVAVVKQDDQVNKQIDPTDYINSSQPASEEEYASQYPATQPFEDTQELEGDISYTDDSSNIDNNIKEENNDQTADNSLNNTTKSMSDDKNGPEKMITDDSPPFDDQKQKKAVNNVMNEVLANKVFDKVDDSGASSEQIKELRELFNENESCIGAMMELEEKMFKLQRDIIKSELKFKAKLVEILENIKKKK